MPGFVCKNRWLVNLEEFDVHFYKLFDIAKKFDIYLLFRIERNSQYYWVFEFIALSETDYLPEEFIKEMKQRLELKDWVVDTSNHISEHEWLYDPRLIENSTIHSAWVDSIFNMNSQNEYLRAERESNSS